MMISSYPKSHYGLCLESQMEARQTLDWQLTSIRKTAFGMRNTCKTYFLNKHICTLCPWWKQTDLFWLNSSKTCDGFCKARIVEVIQNLTLSMGKKSEGKLWIFPPLMYEISLAQNLNFLSNHALIFLTMSSQPYKKKQSIVTLLDDLKTSQ